MQDKDDNQQLAYDFELERRKLLIQTKEDDALMALREAVLSGNCQSAQLQLERAMMIADLRRLTERLAKPADDSGLMYLVGSLFLYDCFSTLVQGLDERMHYVTGLRLAGLLTLDRIVEFELEAASPVSAVGDAASSHAELIRLDRFGHRLHGLFHRHPGKGKEATMPSKVDLDTQSRQERGKYPVIGAIFTEDGYVRFFSGRNQFDLILYGEGVERVEENTYRLTEIS